MLAGALMADWVTTSTMLSHLRDFARAEAWEEFVARFRAPIIAFAMRLGLGRPDAEEAAQEALLDFAAAYRSGEYDRSKGRLSHWLFGIAYRRALRQRRAAMRREVALPQGSGGAADLRVLDEHAATAVWDREWERQLLAQCLERVRGEVEPQTYQAFELVSRLDCPPAEAARALGISVTAVYNAKHRVAKRIRQLRAECEEM
jgi:RNA polymerase sigma-70 factor (ECF subfamily)